MLAILDLRWLVGVFDAVDFCWPAGSRERAQALVCVHTGSRVEWRIALLTARERSLGDVVCVLCLHRLVVGFQEEEGVWSLMKPMIFGAIMDFYAEGKPVMLDEPVVTDTTILEEDDEVVAMIKELLQERVSVPKSEPPNRAYLHGALVAFRAPDPLSPCLASILFSWLRTLCVAHSFARNAFLYCCAVRLPSSP